MEHSHKYWLFRFAVIYFAGSLLLLSCKESEKIPEFTESNTGPYIINTDHLQFIKLHVDSIPTLSQEYQKLISGTDKLLGEQFEYVTDKDRLPPSGDNHDYMSLSRYAWPDSAGIYSENRDGQTNPEIFDYDRPRLARLSSAVYALSLAYYFTENEKYAGKAAELIRRWFLNPETKMNPNMNHAQIAFGVNTGSAQGIIDANDFVNIIEGISLIYKSHHWNYEDHIAMKEWFYEFSVWIIKNYNPDAFESTNVSTWMDVQRAVYFLFTENKENLNSSAHILPISDKIEMQFTPEGTLPNEKNRVRSQHYVYYNLRAYMNLALIRKNRTGSDRDWPVLASNNHAGLRPALESLLLYLEGGDVSIYFNTSEKFDTCRYLEIFKPAAIAFEDKVYEQASRMLLDKGCSNPDITLIFPPLSMLEAESEF